MQKAELFEKRIAFITGKGGVGKTTVAAALAFAAAARGKKVCLVEVNPSPNLRYIFGKEIPLYRETPVGQGVTVLTLEPYKALEEYAGLQLRMPVAARMILNNRVIQYFMQAAPGWRELITVGKIWDMQETESGRKKPVYDMLVVDAPATGHGLSFLRVPAVFMNIIKFGRMQGQTFDVLAMLQDPVRTVVHVVTLPEEMPVNEAVYLRKTAEDALGMTFGATFVNGVYPPLCEKEEENLLCERLKNDPAAVEKLSGFFPDQGRALWLAAESRRTRAALSEEYLGLVREKVGEPVIPIPHFYPGRVDVDGIRDMAEIIGRAVEGEG